MQRITTALIATVLALVTLDAEGQIAAPRMAHSIAAPALRGDRSAVSLPDTVKILAVMVEFQPDDDTRTSGSGRFNTVFPYDYGADIIDAYPHDRAYFASHLRFLANYIAKASGGKTMAVGTVIDTIVTVPKNIRSYSFRNGESEKPVADLASDAWTQADKARPDIDFSAFDMFIVCHAGRGRDVDLASILGSDPTPFDIPSLSFTLNAFRKQLGASFEGIPVNGGAFRITNSSIVPSTDTREIPLLTGQTALLELSINGLLAASFGTYAGLPDLFDTKLGRTGIGRFGLMDAESIFAFGGICPPAPSAWEKQFLGWSTPRVADAGKREYLLSAYRTDQPSTADILRVPISGDEYWLLENRQRDPGYDGQRITYVSGGQDVTMTFPKDTNGFATDDISALKGVVVDVQDIDWSLPGGTVVSDTREARVMGGILVWHIDESVINAGLADNTVNGDRKNRGVDLEQAGGPQDIGETIQSVLGSSVGTGGPLDYWQRDNLSPLYKNSFGAGTTPDTKSNGGYFSHVTVDNFSVSGPLMSFNISVGDNIIAPIAGWPVDMRQQDGSPRSSFVQTADLDGDGAHEIVVASHVTDSTSTEPVLLHIFSQDGTNHRGGGTLPRAAAILTQIQHVFDAPAVGDANGDGVLDIVVHCAADKALRDRVFVVLSTRDADNNGFLDEAGRYYYVTAPSSMPSAGVSGWMIHDGSLLYRQTLVPEAISSFLPPDTLFVRGRLNRAIEIDGAAVRGGGLAATEDPDIVFCSRFQRLSDGIFIPSTSGGQSLNLLEVEKGNCAVSDFDADGSSDAAGAEPMLSMFTRSATWKNGVGLKTPPPPIGSSFTALAAADADGDGRNDLLVTSEDVVAAMNFALSSIDAYPVSSAGADYTLAARLEGDTRDALFIVNRDALTQLGTSARVADGFPVPLPAHNSVTMFPAGLSNPSLGVAVGGSDGRVYLYSTSNRLAANGLVWRSKEANELRGRFAAASTFAKSTRSDFFPDERCYNWPNPVYDPVTKIRYFVKNDADVTVKIYDLAGATVAELSAKAIGGIDNEIDWNVSDVQTGVYLARVKAEGEGRTGEKIIKIAVVK